MMKGRFDMAEKVILEEGSSVSVHTRIKDMCKAARNRQRLTNQDICDRISEQFGIVDFSINTVNNFFSERSKATTIYTTGYICAVLGISIDAVFGIQKNVSTEEEAEFIRQLAELKVEARFKDQQIEHLQETLQEKNDVIKESRGAIEHYRAEINANQKKVQPWVFITVLSMFIGLVIFVLVYLAVFDVGNPNYGIFVSSWAEPYFRTLGIMIL